MWQSNAVNYTVHRFQIRAFGITPLSISFIRRRMLALSSFGIRSFSFFPSSILHLYYSYHELSLRTFVYFPSSISIKYKVSRLSLLHAMHYAEQCLWVSILPSLVQISPRVQILGLHASVSTFINYDTSSNSCYPVKGSKWWQPARMRAQISIACSNNHYDSIDAVKQGSHCVAFISCQCINVNYKVRQVDRTVTLP